jgi:hypothetical protein
MYVLPILTYYSSLSMVTLLTLHVSLNITIILHVTGLGLITLLNILYVSYDQVLLSIVL